MTHTTPSLADLTAAAISVLCRELGPANTARFLNQFSAGIGNYTEERDALIGSATVHDLIRDIKRRRGSEPSDSPAKTSRSRKR